MTNHSLSDDNGSLTQQLLFAVEREDVQEVEKLLKRGADPLASPLALQLAFDNENFALIKIILEAGADANWIDVNRFPEINYREIIQSHTKYWNLEKKSRALWWASNFREQDSI